MRDNIQFAVRAMQDIILTHAEGDPVVAYQIAVGLASLDWEEVLEDQKNRQLGGKIAAMKMFLEWTGLGGRYCDNCGGYPHGRMYERGYHWPYTFPPSGYLSIEQMWGKVFCWKCLSGMSNNQCSWQKRMCGCSICNRLIPFRSTWVIQMRSYCFHCLEQAVEQQFIACCLCQKRTASASRNYCYDCYQRAMPLHQQLGSHLARAREANAPATLTLREWVATVAYFGEKCAYCLSHPFEVLEHFIPISMGGGTTADNCVPACAACNRRKNNIHPDRIDVLSFPQGAISRVRAYLQGEKEEYSPYTTTERALIVIPSTDNPFIEDVAQRLGIK